MIQPDLVLKEQTQRTVPCAPRRPPSRGSPASPRRVASAIVRSCLAPFVVVIPSPGGGGGGDGRARGSWGRRTCGLQRGSLGGETLGRPATERENYNPPEAPLFWRGLPEQHGWNGAQGLVSARFRREPPVTGRALKD